jgi:hypothetical protein
MKPAILAGLATAAFLTSPLDARITRIVVEHKESPAYEGQSFGEGGRYERLSGRAYGELDPKDPLNWRRATLTGWSNTRRRSYW